MNTVEYRRSVPVKGEYDILVAGGGVAGAAAAVQAARLGKRVLLIEKAIALGGLATIGLVNFFVPMCNGRGTQIIKGMAEEFLRLSIHYGYDTIPDEWKNGEPGEGATTRYMTRFSAPIFMLALTELLHREGVELLFDTVITEPVMEGGICRGLIVENKSGSEYYGAKMIVDTTGDADILYRAGVPTVQGINYHTFSMIGATLDSCAEAAERRNMSFLQRGYMGGVSNLYGGGHPEGKPFWKGTDALDISSYVVENHIEALQKLKASDRSQRDILQLPTMAQMRTTRHIDGDYTLTVGDTYRHFEDSIGAICDFDRSDYLYEVPFRTLVKNGFPNLVTAGRSASAEGYAWDVLRVIPPAIITGQAAGAACSLAIDSGSALCNIDIPTLQRLLEERNVTVHFDEALVPEDKTKSRHIDVGHI